MTTQTPDAVREALQGFINDLTGSLRNRDTMLTINHDALRRRIAQGQAALDSRAGDAGEANSPCPYTCSACLGRSTRRCETTALNAASAPAVDADEMPERDYSEGEELAIAIHNSMRFRALKNIQQVMRHLENITPANDLRGSIVGLLDALCLKVSENLPEASHIAAAQALSKPAVDAVADRQINTTRVDDREAAVGAECNLCHGLNTSCHDGCEIIHEAVDAVPVGEVVERLKETADDLRKIGWHEDRQNVLDAIAALSHGEGRK